MPLQLPFDPASSIQAERMAWAIERYADGELTAAQVEATHEFDPGFDVTQQLRRFRVFRRPVDEVLAYEHDAFRPRAIVRCGQDEAVVSVRLGDPPDYPIIAMSLQKRPPAGVAVRFATEADGPGLRDLERRCAVEVGGVSVSYDRGDDYFAQHRLMEHHLTSVVEHEGRIVGVLSDAVRRIRVAGTEYRATYRFHLRVDPAERGQGILPALNSSNGREIFRERPLPIPSAFIAAENAQMLEMAGEAQREILWATSVERMTLPCRELAGPSCGRAALPSDAARIASLLDAAHGAEELALGFDAESVTTRLTRSPRDYSWTNVTIAERAVLGVWDSGLRIIRSDGAGSTERRSATVLDYGFEPEAEADLEALLRSACSSLQTAGVDDLVIFTSPASRGRDLLARLARSVESFRVQSGGPMPTRDATRGTYVDPVYF